MSRRGRVTRRDLLLQVAELDRLRPRGRQAGRSLAAAGWPPGRGRAGRAAEQGRSPGPRPTTRRPATAPTRGTATPSTPSNGTRSATPGSGPRPPPSPRRPPRRRRSSRSSSPSTLGDEPGEGEVSGLPEMTVEERMRAELEILGLDVSRHVVDSLRAVPRRARRRPQPRPAHPAQQVRAAGRRGQGRHPDPADPLRAPGHLPDPRRRDRPGRRDVLRGRPGPVRRHGVPLLAAGGARRAAPDRLPRRLAAGHRLLGAAGAVTRSGSATGIEAVRELMAVVPEGFAGVGAVDAVPGAAESPVEPAGDGQAATPRPS